MEAGADLQERVNVALDLERTGGGLNHVSDQLEKCALARTIPADDGDLFATADFEVDAVERRVLGERVRPVAQESEHVHEAIRRLRVETVNLLQIGGSNGEVAMGGRHLLRRQRNRS